LSVAGFLQVAAATPKELYLNNCSMCHGIDGKAETPIAKKLRIKNLTESKFSITEIENRIIAGVNDAKGVSRMPSFEQKISKEEIAALASFVKSLQN
jgi:mono/diheme cytochrome c family protein